NGSATSRCPTRSSARSRTRSSTSSRTARRPRPPSSGSTRTRTCCRRSERPDRSPEQGRPCSGATFPAPHHGSGSDRRDALGRCRSRCRGRTPEGAAGDDWPGTDRARVGRSLLTAATWEPAPADVLRLQDMSAASRRGQETDPATARAPADVPGAPAWAPRRRFHAPCGSVEGRVDGHLARATGIRYARADRFREPVPAPDADGIIEATSWSPAAPQHPDAALEAMYGADVRPLRSDEDCHFLSVTMPGDLAANERVPVMVWIHGGS